MLDISDPKNAAAIAQSPDWQTAVTDLLALWAQDGRPYSSGEVASALRTHRKDLHFSVPTLGKYVRDAFYGQKLPEYPDFGVTGLPTNSIPPVQVGRFTVGKFPTRTPAGVEVFVYGADQNSAAGHEFEVFVPKPGETLSDAPPDAAPQSTAAVTGPGTPAQNAAIAIYGAKPAVTHNAVNVAADGRLYVGRPIFEACCHLGGTPIRAGDPVFVEVEPGVKAVVTLKDPGNGAAKEYSLWSGQGRIAVTCPDPTKPFIPHATYKVVVGAGVITVDLSAPQ